MNDDTLITVADIDRQIEELQKQRDQFVKELPMREERRAQLAGEALMKCFRTGDPAAASWLARIRETARVSDEDWLFELEYLKQDGYTQIETSDGKTAWKTG